MLSKAFPSPLAFKEPPLIVLLLTPNYGRLRAQSNHSLINRQIRSGQRHTLIMKLSQCADVLAQDSDSLARTSSKMSMKKSPTLFCTDVRRNLRVSTASELCCPNAPQTSKQWSLECHQKRLLEPQMGLSPSMFLRDLREMKLSTFDVLKTRTPTSLERRDWVLSITYLRLRKQLDQGHVCGPCQIGVEKFHCGVQLVVFANNIYLLLSPVGKWCSCRLLNDRHACPSKLQFW